MLLRTGLVGCIRWSLFSEAYAGASRHTHRDHPHANANWTTLIIMSVHVYCSDIFTGAAHGVWRRVLEMWRHRPQGASEIWRSLYVAFLGAVTRLIISFRLPLPGLHRELCVSDMNEPDLNIGTLWLPPAYLCESKLSPLSSRF